MFTFREKQQHSIHPHRLLYLHSTEKDRNIAASTKRFKTQLTDVQESIKNSQGYYYTANNTDNSKTCRYGSQRKIKYFDLDLKSLVNTTMLDSEISSERSSKKTTESVLFYEKNYNPKGVSPKNLLKQISQNKRANQIKNKNIGKNNSNSKKPNQVLQEIEDLIQKEYIADIQNLQMVKDFKKAKNKGQNSKQFKQKYTKIKMNHCQPYQKLFPSTLLKTKTKNCKQNQGSLQLKRVERLLVDKMGNEYKVTIEKIL